MDKILTFPGKTDRGIFTYVIDAEKSYLEKTAAEYHPTIAAYINNAKPIKGKSQLLITALGALEFWGDNVNGDAFPEEALANPGPDYGYETFKLYAKVFKHHINKPDSQSYGEVILSVYNPTYHRVELIVSVDHALAPDIIARIEAGDYPDWSMGCFSKYAKVLMKDGSEKYISELNTGDCIINGMGGASKVDYPHSHKHTGTWYHVKTLGLLRDPEKATEEHPWYVIPKEQVECQGNSNNKGRKINLCLPNSTEKKGCVDCLHTQSFFNPQWVRSDELRVGDYIATPTITSEDKEIEYKYAFLAGHYVANGYGAKDWKCVVLTVNNEALFLEDEFKRLFPLAKIYSRPRLNTNQASDIFICDKTIYNTLVSDFGRTLTEKTIFKVFEWSKESQKVFLGAFIDGDGGRYRDSLYISTSKELIAYHLQMLLAGVGCISSVNTILHKPSTIIDKDTVEYQVWIGQDSAYTICEYSHKGSGIEKPKMFKNLRFIANGFLWSPILSIDTEDCDEDVYNVAVKSDSHDTDSYVINGISLHNCKVPFDVCSICGNKAPTRKQYCHHARYLLGKIDPETGKKVYVINTKPKFFDISLVLIGADRIAKTLKKVAFAGHSNLPIISSAYLAEKAAEQKRAEMEKEVPANEPPSSQESLKELARSIAEVKSMEAPIPNRILDSLAEHPLPKVLSTMTMMGIIPKPQEFQRIFLISHGHRGLADDLSAKNMCFDPMSVEDSTPQAERAIDLGHHNFDGSILNKLLPFMEDRSYFSPFLGKRIVVMIKSGTAQPLPTFIKVSAEDVKKERTPISPALMLLITAGAYAALAHKAPTAAVTSVEKVLSTPAGLGLATVLGLGLIKTFNRVAGPGLRGQHSGDNPRSNPDVNDVFSRIEEMKQKPFNKVGMQKNASIKRLILGPTAAYMASGVLQKHKEFSPYDEEGRIRSFVRRNPDIISAALVADAVLTARKHPFSSGQILEKAKGLAGHAKKHLSKFAEAAQEVDSVYGSELSKTADGQEFLSQSLIWPLAMGRANLPARVLGGLFDQAVIESSRKLLDKRKQSKI